MLQLRDITISIGGEPPLVAGLSVDIAAGSMRLIQGASGSGKSTLLSVISGTAGRAVNTTGDVLLNGRLVSALDAEDRRIGLMYQDPLLFPHMSVGDNLAFALSPAHRHDRQRDDQSFSASDPIHVSTKHDRTERAHQKSRAESHEGREQRGEFIAGREKSVRDIGRVESEQEEVEHL